MSSVHWFLSVGAVLLALGVVRVALEPDLVKRLLALNVAAAGGLVVLVGVAARPSGGDPVPHALALTGIVITVAVTAVGLALTRRIEQGTDEISAQGSATDEVSS